MPEVQKRHPELDELTAFGLGRLSEFESQGIELHLSDCEECRLRLEAVPDDGLVHLLQAAAAAAQVDTGGLSGATEPLSPPPTAEAVRRDFPIPRALEGHARYQVLGLLGTGGMGTVYKARHRLMDRIVALKIVHPSLLNKPEAASRFTREVKAASQLVHPNIVTAYDAEMLGDLHLLVMECIDGQTLAQTLADQRELPIAKACLYVLQTALGLQHALDHGMVHRDIKPQNLMLTQGGGIKILDFGLARFVRDQTHSDGATEEGTLMGSPDYMAPEQGDDAHSADTRADIYGMGCTLYHCLAGQIPFPAASLLEKLEAHRDRQPRPLDQVRREVPIELSRVVAKMMAKDPAQRYQTPVEVAAALRPFTLTEPAPAPQPAPQPATRSSRQRQFTVALGTLLLLAFIGFGAAQIVFRVETPHGTLIVQTDDPDVQISVKSGGKEVALFFPKHEKEISLEVGKYTLELVKGKNGLKLSTNKFEITSGEDHKTVSVEFVPAVAASQGPPSQSRPAGTPIPANPPPPAIAPFTAAEAKAHQEAWANHLDTQVETINSVGATMILIPPGEFLMGSSDEEVAAGMHLARQYKVEKSERPQRRVVISKPFLMGATEVTFGQFNAFVVATSYKTAFERIAASPHTYREFVGATDDIPVVVVAWEDALAYCNWLSERENAEYRLPTEAEWEYACRSGSTTKFSFGDDYAALNRHAWFRGSPGSLRNRVGSLLSNAFGLFDMHGSVYEFCHEDPSGPSASPDHLHRGGSWNSTPFECRSAFRINHRSPGSDDIGFRVARDL